MKKSIILITFLAILGFVFYRIIEIYQFGKGVQKDTPKFVETLLKNQIQSGDIIFHTSKSEQSKAIQLATKSKYSHMGIIYKIDDQLYVYEAVEPVKLTPLKDWIKRGENGKFVIKRLVNSDEIVSRANLDKMKQVGEKYKGKHYDLYFEWSDDRIYCSELVWKIYKEGANVEIGELEELSSFDLSSKLVRQKMEERYGKEIPMHEMVITPVQIFNSNKLKTVLQN